MSYSLPASLVPAWYPLLLQDVLPDPGSDPRPVPPPLRLLSAVLFLVPLGSWLPTVARRGRRPSPRQALAAAFLAKAILNLPTTRSLLARLHLDEALRTRCGFPTHASVPSESTFSRALAQFAAKDLPEHWHAALIRATQTQRLIGHIARDSTAIAARERFPAPARPRASKSQPKSPRSRPQRAAQRGVPPTRLPRQRTQTLAQMRRELPAHCSLGVKTSSRGYRQHWRGYKLHLDVADGQIPISAVLTGAHVHDSQVAIPLMTMSAERGLTWLYDLMDTAYDSNQLLAHGRQQGHVPIVPPHSRRKGHSQLPKIFPPSRPELTWAEQDRFRERTMVERVFARLKDEFGGRHLRVRGAQKVMAHLMMGVIALTVDQLLRWAATAEPSTTHVASATCR